LSNTSPDISPVVRDDVRRLTYAELAAIRGISRASAERLARRKRWPRQVGNDGIARVIVPLAAVDGATPDNMADNHPSHQVPDKVNNVSGTTTDIMGAIREVITPLAAALEHERARADRLEMTLADAVAAERIAAGEAMTLRSREDERRRWRLLRRLWWAISAR
jgi:hypothetical protein